MKKIQVTLFFLYPKSNEETNLWPQAWQLVIPRYVIFKKTKKKLQ